MDLAGRRARLATVAAVVLFVGFTVWALATQGLQLSHDWLFIWLVLGLLALSLSDVKRWARGVIFDWLPFAGFLIAYDVVRGFADNLGIAPHASTGIDFDRAYFGHTLPTNWLQDRLFDPAVAHWYDYVTFFVYLSHFFVTLLIAAFLWRYRYSLFRRWRAMVLGVAAAGFATYALFPGTPPWLAAQDGRLPPITRTIGYMWQHVHMYPAASLFETGNGYVNDVAAIPSLHAAYSRSWCSSSGEGCARGRAPCCCSIRWRWASRSCTRASTTSSTWCWAGSTPWACTRWCWPTSGCARATATRRRCGRTSPSPRRACGPRTAQGWRTT